MPGEQPIYEKTRAELVRAYREYSDYDQVAGTERAAKFIQAARQLLLITPKRSASQLRGDEIEMAPEVMQLELTKADAWYRARGGANASQNQLPRQFQPDCGWR